MSRAAKSRVFLLIGCSVLFVCLESDRGLAETGSRPPHVLKMCILPFYTSASRANLDGDLGPLLEAGLSGNRWLELIPAKTVYESTYTLQPPPWLVKGIWKEGSGARDAEVYFWFRKRLLQRVRARFPADYNAIGRVITTGTRKTLVIEIVEPGPRQEVVFTATQGADSAEAIPEAVTGAAAEILAFLEPRWSVGYLEEVRKLYLSQGWSLRRAVRESAEQVKAHPARLPLRVYLLSLYEEDQDAYGPLAGDTAAEIVRRWDGPEEEARGLAERLGVDAFIILCREQAREEDWSGVLETVRLGCEKNPLSSTEYERWRLRAREQLEGNTGEKNSIR